MFPKVKIGVKIIILVIMVVIVSVLAIGIISYNHSWNTLKTQYEESISAIAKSKKEKIESFFTNIKNNITFTSKLQSLKEKFPEFSENIQTNSTDSSKTQTADTLQEKVNEELEEIADAIQNDDELEDLISKQLIAYNINSTYFLDKEGIVIFKIGKDKANKLKATFKHTQVINPNQDSVVFSNILTRNKEEKYMLVSRKIVDNTQNTLGTLVYDVNLDKVFEYASDTTGLGKTGEIVLAKKVGEKIYYLNEARSGKVKPNISLGSRSDKSLQKAISNQRGTDFTKNAFGKEVLSAWTYLPTVDWALAIQIHKKEVFESLTEWNFSGLMLELLVGGLIIIFAASLLAFFLSQEIVNPLIILREYVDFLAIGRLPKKVKKTSGDEVGEISDNLNNLNEHLKQLADFADSIGRGDYEQDLKLVSEEDILGNALLKMRDSIQKSAKKDDERNWIVAGLAEIGDILPSINTIEALGDLVTDYVTNRIGALQGAFYVVDDETLEKPSIQLKASYAYKKKKYLQAEFRFAEGLIGQAAAEQDTIIRTEIPDSYLSISSGILGDRKPRCILITPLITNETVYGVIEFAGLEKFDNREIEFVKEISELIARTLFNIRVKENTELLLKESNERGEQLQQQREVLFQSADFMEAQTKELERNKKELEVQVQKVQEANERTQLLLENASEVITIYKENLEIQYISPSVEKILGYSVEEMIGTRDIYRVHQEALEKYEGMFATLVAQPDEKVTIEFRYETKQGEYIWVEATGTNLLQDQAIQGIVLNIRDITERKEAEKEQRLRGQMEALSENSPDLITRITREGTIFYINPIIETYTGLRKEDYLQKSIDDLELNKEIVESWQNVVREAITKNQKINMDMDFPSIMGNRIMTINAIPEYGDGEQNTVESVLLVSHDITERKIIELEISQKNRKITESINYAKRIQEAILPDTAYLKQFFDDSFILYKPKDVVSGDFPWFLKKGDDIYVAAVDCTGHGVPGALMSLIGFFLLNNIIKTKEVTKPSIILDLLDEDVTETLQQDKSEASAKDGMDISLCRINKVKKQIEYAGAHRPLYYLSKGELLEIRGDKFPIGGAQYKNRGRFTNTVINYDKGESVYLFSDGFPDQFGGPKNKKFSPRRIRDLLTENAETKLSTTDKILNDEFENWKGNNKQTDDVLMIGIKF